MSKTILVFGASGTIGLGVLKASLDQADIKVVGVFRSDESAQKASTRLGNPSSDKFVTVIGTLTSEQDAAELLKKVTDKVGSYTDVVNTIGGAPSGFMPILQVSLDELRKVVSTDKLEPHFLVAKYFLPPIQDKPGTSFTAINGIAEMLMPNFGHPLLGTAAIQKLMKYLMFELKDKPVRINECPVSFMVTPWDNPDSMYAALGAGPTADNVKLGKALLGLIVHPKCKGESVTMTVDNLQKVAQEGAI